MAGTANNQKSVKPSKNSREQEGGAPSADNAQCGPDGDLDLARGTLRAVCQDPNAPASARASAARTLAELAGGLKAETAKENKGLDDLTLADIDRMLAG